MRSPLIKRAAQESVGEIRVIVDFGQFCGGDSGDHGPPEGGHYSERSAEAGSIRIARRVGTNIAATPAHTRIAQTDT
jgi:hypothetical protein